VCVRAPLRPVSWLMICHRRASVCSHECDKSHTPFKRRDSHKRCGTEAGNQLKSNPMMRGGQSVVDLSVSEPYLWRSGLFYAALVYNRCLHQDQESDSSFMLSNNKMKR